uniref:lysozyme n=1 Tax=Acrobeloides nanus TaxID=290746 RepID=A0A914DTM1_9BILA
MDEGSYSCGWYQNYVNRYAFNCPEKQGCELVSRIHNSGPRGCQTTRSDWYWNKIQYCLRQKKFENYFLEMIQSRSPPNSASTFFNPIQNSPLLLRVPSGPFNSDFTYYNDAGYGACGTVINAQTEMLIAEAIKSAKTLAEVEHLQSMLLSGRIPDKGRPDEEMDVDKNGNNEKENEEDAMVED